MAVQLPPELLLQIFLEIPQDYWDEVREKAPPCCSVSQVCRQWRAIAVGSGRLWNRIPHHSLSWTRECLIRSNNSCIEVDTWILTPEEKEERRSLMLIYSELSRVSKLKIATATNYDDSHELINELFAGLSMQPAPKLRELDLSISDDVDDDRPLIVLPRRLFQSQKLRSLEKLTIHFCEMTLPLSKIFVTAALRSLKLLGGLAWRDVD